MLLSVPTLILFSHARLGLPSCIFTSSFSTKIFGGCLFFLIRATCPAYFVCLEWSPMCNIRRTAGRWSSSLLDTLPSPVISSHLLPVFLHSTLLSNNFFFVLWGRRKLRLTHCSHLRLIVLIPALVPRLSPEALHIRRRERPLFAKEGIMGEKWPTKFSLIMRLPRHCRVFNMLQSCDMGQMALLPLRRKACWGFFRPEFPTASAGFEPAILGTRCENANH
jgi:hypothetical protein